MKDHLGAWWDECNKPEFSKEEFRKAFRIGRTTLDSICEELSSMIANIKICCFINKGQNSQNKEFNSFLYVFQIM